MASIKKIHPQIFIPNYSQQDSIPNETICQKFSIYFASDNISCLLDTHIGDQQWDSQRYYKRTLDCWYHQQNTRILWWRYPITKFRGDRSQLC